MAEPPPEMRKKMSVSLLAFLSRASAARAAAKRVFVGQRVAAFKVAEAPVALLGNLVVAADAAQALAALHAVEQGFEHGSGGLAERDDKDALVAGEVDGGRAAAVGHEAVERVALEAQAAVEGGGDVAGLDGAGKDFGGRGVQSVESGIAGRGHEQLLLEPAGERRLHRCQMTGKKVIGAGEEHQSFGIGGGCGHLRQLGGGRELVAVSAEKELGKGAVLRGRDSGSRGRRRGWAGRVRRGRGRWDADLRVRSRPGASWPRQS